MEDLYEKNKVKMLRLYLYTKRHTQDKGNSTDTLQLTTSEVTGNVAQNFNQVQASEPEVITIDLLLQESDVIQLDEDISHMQMLSAHTRDEGMYVVEIEDTQFTGIEQGQEDQGAGVTDVVKM